MEIGHEDLGEKKQEGGNLRMTDFPPPSEQDEKTPLEFGKTVTLNCAQAMVTTAISFHTTEMIEF